MKRKMILILSVLIIVMLAVMLTIGLLSQEDNTAEAPINYAEIEVHNYNEDYSDVYVSNVPVDVGSIDVPLDSYPWYTALGSLDYSYNVHQWITYAIHTYYNGNVPDVFSCSIPEDITHTETNMIFTVTVHGEYITLEILLDTYNNKIVVSEI